MGILGAVIAFHVHTQIAPGMFNTWNKLLNHTYKSHAKQTTPKPLETSTFQCHVCSCRELATERDFFQHLNGPQA